MTTIIKQTKLNDSRVEVVVRDDAEKVVDLLGSIMTVDVVNNGSCYDVTDYINYWTVIPHGTLTDAISLRDAIKLVL